MFKAEPELLRENLRDRPGDDALFKLLDIAGLCHIIKKLIQAVECFRVEVL